MHIQDRETVPLSNEQLKNLIDQLPTYGISPM